MFYEMTGFAPADLGPTDGSPGAPRFERTALFLNFDGTLVDLADTPDAIRIEARLSALLGDLRTRLGGALCIITGRPMQAVERHLPGYRGDVIAAHGVERRVAGKLEVHPLAGSDAVERLQGVVVSFARLDPAFLVERKPAGVVLHFRQKPDLFSEAYRFMESISGHFPDFRVQPAKMAVEMKPADVGKVTALRWLMAHAPYAGRTPWYFGDDDADEPAMEWVAAQGGCACKVGDGETHATHRLDSVAAVHDTLAQWLERETEGGAACQSA